jgi:DNA-binding response OmpR family regulator
LIFEDVLMKWLILIVMDKLILLLEDEESLRENIKEILEFNHFKVIEFSNGFEAVRYLKENEVSLIISDLIMPVMDGHEFLVQVKSEARCTNTPFILLSAKTDKIAREKSLELGANIYFTKPFKTYDLINSIQSIL